MRLIASNCLELFKNQVVQCTQYISVKPIVRISKYVTTTYGILCDIRKVSICITKKRKIKPFAMKPVFGAKLHNCLQFGKGLYNSHDQIYNILHIQYSLVELLQAANKKSRRISAEYEIQYIRRRTLHYLCLATCALLDLLYFVRLL